MSEPYVYVGEELELFAAAVNWKRYFRSKIVRYFGADVLEVGAGLGGTTKLLCGDAVRRWVCLEPDAALAEQLGRSIESGDLPACCRVVVGSVADLAGEPPFDTIIYIDVLEHIEDDAGELARAATLLAPGGRLVVLAPAHQFLFSPFDEAIGHYRRYTRKTLAAAAPEALDTLRIFYLDSVGFFASLANRLLLRSAMPTAGQIAVWDKLMVPPSRWVDPLLAYRTGKSVVGVWRKAT